LIFIYFFFYIYILIGSVIIKIPINLNH
jgi:hypothetical protein